MILGGGGGFRQTSNENVYNIHKPHAKTCFKKLNEEAQCNFTVNSIRHLARINACWLKLILLALKFRISKERIFM